MPGLTDVQADALRNDPFALQRVLWPGVYFYEKQREVIRSVHRDDETFVYAGNMLGKDFVAGYICVSFFLTWYLLGETCRVITCSVKEEHLYVLWSEIARFVTSSKYPLLKKDGGPLTMLSMEIRRADEDDAKNPTNYLKGMVAGGDMDALAGHHAARTLGVGDEASGLKNWVHDKYQGWAKRKLYFGNPNPCENFFRNGCREGDIARETGEGFHRKVVQIRATDSPNVIIGEAQERLGESSSKPVVPGILSYEDYKFKRKTWDKVRRTIGLDAEWYEGADLLLFPPEWLSLAEQLDLRIHGRPRKALGMGVDPAEGGDSTAIAVVDELGLIELISLKTPNTAGIKKIILNAMRRHGLESTPEKVVIDKGGGGKQIADQLREMGYDVRTLGFGESVTPGPKRGMSRFADRVEVWEEKYTYANRRSEMFGEFSLLLDPYSNPRAIIGKSGQVVQGGFAIPAHGDAYSRLRKQLAVIPRDYDKEGRLSLRPKNHRSVDRDNKSMKVKTLVDLIGHSPDEADAVALAVWAMQNAKRPNRAGAVV